MLAFSQPMTPAIRAHLEAQYSMFNDLSQKIFETAQKINELNIQVAKTVVEDSFNNTQQVMVANDPYEALSIAASQAQPAAEQIRSYQQSLTNLAARTQVDLVRTAESHVPNTSRTAAAIADEIARRTTEETEKATLRQKAALDRLTNPGDRPPTPDAKSQPMRATAGQQ